MHRLLFRTVCRARNHALHVYEGRVSSGRCDIGAVSFIRAANGVGPKAISTSSICHCEKKNGVLLPKEGEMKGGVQPLKESEKTDARKDVELTDTVTLAEGKVDDGHKLINTMPEQLERLVEVKAEVESTAQQKDDTISVVAETNTVQQTEVESTKPLRDDTAKEVVAETEHAVLQAEAKGTSQLEDDTIKEVAAKEESIVVQAEVESTVQLKYDAVKEVVAETENIVSQTEVEGTTQLVDEPAGAEINIPQTEAAVHTLEESTTQLRRDTITEVVAETENIVVQMEAVAQAELESTTQLRGDTVKEVVAETENLVVQMEAVVQAEVESTTQLKDDAVKEVVAETENVQMEAAVQAEVESTTQLRDDTVKEIVAETENVVVQAEVDVTTQLRDDTVKEVVAETENIVVQMEAAVQAEVESTTQLKDDAVKEVVAETENIVVQTEEVVQAEVEGTTQLKDDTVKEVVAEVRDAVEPDTKQIEQKLSIEVKEVAESKEMVKEKEGEQTQTKKAPKSGKENLLDLLGAMKVELTTKKKFKSVKPQPSQEPPVKPKPEALESTIAMFQSAKVETPPQREKLNPELVAALSAAASTLPNRQQAESELLQQLRQHEAIAEAQKKGDVNNLGTIIADMKVGKRPNARQNTRPANQIRFDDDGRGYTHDRGVVAELDGVRRRKSLFTGKRLNIFSPPTDQQKADSLTVGPTLWDIDFTNELVQSTNQLPRNGFEEMIQWTKEGKLWQYPINNEIGLDEESLVPFHEHVFLDKHLEDGFPSQGPVRHFMELVVAGLVKNPHLTVRQKQEHIAWFRDYFQQKEEVLKEADVYLN